MKLINQITMPRFIKNNVFSFILLLIFFLGGFFFGRLIKDIPFLTLDTEVGIGDLANFLLALVVALLIPLSLSPIIKNKRVLKDFLIDEVKNCLNFLSSIKIIIDELALKGTTSETDRLKVNSMISRDLSMKFDCLSDQLEMSFDGKSKSLRENINKEYKEYWDDTTGGELMSEKFKFDIRFRNSHDKNYAKMETCLKKAVHEINTY